MSKQEIYDKVCKHLARQKTRAMVGDMCAYRTEDGKRCAVGCLIPYHVWKNEISDMNTGVSSMELCRDSKWANENLGSSRRLLEDLQFIHDYESYGYDAKAIRASLVETAKLYRIKPGAEQYIRTWKP